MTEVKTGKNTSAALLVVGSVALDTVETSRDRREEILGGAACFSCCAASFFTPTRLVGVVGTDFPAAHEDFLRSRGIVVTERRGTRRDARRRGAGSGGYDWPRLPGDRG